MPIGSSAVGRDSCPKLDRTSADEAPISLTVRAVRYQGYAWHLGNVGIVGSRSRLPLPRTCVFSRCLLFCGQGRTPPASYLPPKPNGSKARPANAMCFSALSEHYETI